MKRIILSLGTIVALGAVVAGGTTAFFSDTETSPGNTFTAGAIDLQIDNESYYNGEANDGTSWGMKSLVEGEDFFFHFLDLKPDDEGEDTISIHVSDNPAWACMDVTVTAFNDNGCTEPEFDDEELLYGAANSTCGNPGDGEGELQNEINFIWWPDDGDNVLEDDEAELIFQQTSLSDLEIHVPLADASGHGLFGVDPLDSSTTYFIGKAWCYGTLQIDPLNQDLLGKTGSNGPLDRGTGIICDGTGINNVTQTDSVEGTVSFSAEQSRHNDLFICNPDNGLCSEQVDVMLVLDRSGSIDVGDLATMKTAAKAFVDALAPSADGVHIGLVSFSTGSSLDLHLSATSSDIKSAIDGLTSGGSTNLAAGITTADAELDNPGDGHDRPDGVSPDVMVIITDGAPNIPPGSATSSAALAATLAKGDGIEIFAVGVDITASNANFLKADIVSAPDATHYFDAVDFAALEAILAGLAVCEDPVLVAGP